MSSHLTLEDRVARLETMAHAPIELRPTIEAIVKELIGYHADQPLSEAGRSAQSASAQETVDQPATFSHSTETNSHAHNDLPLSTDVAETPPRPECVNCQQPIISSAGEICDPCYERLIRRYNSAEPLSVSHSRAVIRNHDRQRQPRD